jgi:hypothetical protein
MCGGRCWVRTNVDNPWRCLSRGVYEPVLPGGYLVVGGAGFEATVQDAGHAAGELAQGRVVACACRKSRPWLWPAELLSCRPAVMIIDHVLAVHVPPDHAASRVAAASPA